MIGAKVNGVIVPIDRVLENGEIVEVLTSSSMKGPSRDWLKIAQTSAARAKIRQWFKKERYAENVAEGRAQVISEMKRFGRVFTEDQFDQIVSKTSSRMGMNTADDLYNMLGYGGITIAKVLPKLRDEFNKTVTEAVAAGDEQFKLSKPRRQKNNSGVIVDDLDGCQVKFARCCNPLPGDGIVGFITVGHGISVHKSDCPNMLRAMNDDTDRFVRVTWCTNNDEMASSQFEALMKVYVADRISMLADISVALADMRVSIIQINTQKLPSDRAVINITVGCKNLTHFNSMVSRLRGIKGVEDIQRGNV
jgi:GTP pyrophosphokinase